MKPMIKTITQLIILTSLTLTPALGFSGQHSGLGGTPPAPTPAPEPTMFETLEQYYQQYYQWLREQMESSLEQPTVLQNRK